MGDIGDRARVLMGIAGRKLKPCSCGRTGEPNGLKHGKTCPVRVRAAQRKSVELRKAGK